MINNSDTVNELIFAGNLKPATELVPKGLSTSVVPVININPKDYRNVTVIKTTSSTTSAASVIIYTTPTDKDFYLVGITNSFTKDATCDMANSTGYVNVLYDGVNSIFCRLSCLTLTAQDSNMNIDFNRPIKVDRGTNITLNYPTYTAGSAVKCASIYGYTVEQR